MRQGRGLCLNVWLITTRACCAIARQQSFCTSISAGKASDGLESDGRLQRPVYSYTSNSYKLLITHYSFVLTCLQRAVIRSVDCASRNLALCDGG